MASNATGSMEEEKSNHSDEGLTSETSVSDMPDFHGVQLSLQFPLTLQKTITPQSLDLF